MLFFNALTVVIALFRMNDVNPGSSYHITFELFMVQQSQYLLVV